MRSAIGALASAGATLAVQIVALVSLDAPEFGLFSLLYLLGAFALSLALSTICEPWTRTASHTGVLSGWDAYGGVSVSLSAATAALAGIVALIIPGTASGWWLASIAVYATTYRLCARYYSVRLGQWRGVLAADLGALVVAGIGGVWAFIAYRGELFAILAVWAAAAAIAGLLSKPAPLPRLRGPSEWMSRHGDAIRPLLRDSLIMDGTAIGTPYILAPILGIADFGVYRAVSNVAAPVRLVLNPLRPWFSTLPVSVFRSGRFLLANLAAAILIGAAAWCAVWLIGVWGIELGTLSDLPPFAVAVGLFVAGNCLGHVYYIGARHHVTGRGMLTGRATQTVLSVLGPISAALVAGLSGAIWAYAIATVLSAVGWLIVVRRSDS